jgi:ADP-ribosyl-[dinitrogen reductase] hydrolase
VDERDRAVGAVVGLAVGDALGAPFAAEPRAAIPDPIPAFELPVGRARPGTGTDATAMTRNVLTSLLAHGGALDLDDVLARQLAWFATWPDPLDPQTAKVLTRYVQGDPDAARWYVETRGPEVSGGNGALRWCGPLGVARTRDRDRLETEAPALAALTHRDERCATSCLAVTLAIAALVGGAEPEPSVIGAMARVEGMEGAEELEYLIDEVGRAREIDRRHTGFTLFAAGAALQVTGEALGFEAGLRHVVSLGGDTAANGAVAGALRGARHGRRAIPGGWLDRLADREAIEREAEALARLV